MNCPNLTAQEMEELKQLSDELFNGDCNHFSKNVMFKVFTEEERQTDKFKRYDILLKQRLRDLKEMNK